MSKKCKTRRKGNLQLKCAQTMLILFLTSWQAHRRKDHGQNQARRPNKEIRTGREGNRRKVK